MTRINTNVASLRGLRSLNSANELQNTTLQRLSTGLKINSGKDNPAGLIAGETLRSQISTIEQSIKNSNRASNVISTADAALGEVNNLLNQVRGLVQESLNSGALSQDEIEANQLQIDAALSAINRISANTTFAGDKLIDGSKSFITQQSSANASKLTDFQINQAIFGTSSSIELEAVVTQAAEKAELQYGGANLSADTTLEIAGSNGSEVVFLDDGSTKSQIRAAINSVSDVTGVTASQVDGLNINGGATQGSVEISTNATAATLAAGLGNATASTIDISFNAGADVIQLTDARATSSTGAVGDLGGDITFEIVDGGVGGNTINVVGNAITVDLGGAALTVSNLETLIDGDVAAAALVGTSVTAGGAGNSAVSASVGLDADGTSGVNESVLTLTDARTTSTEGAVATLGGDITLEIVDGGVGGAQVGVVGNAITVDLGGATIDADALEALIDGSTAAAALVDTAVTSGGSTDVVVAAAQGLAADGTDGLDASVLTVTDNRAAGAGGSNETLGGALDVQIGDFSGGALNQTLGASIVQDSAGNKTIQVQLATNGAGVAQGATAQQIADVIDTAVAASDSEVTTAVTGGNITTVGTATSVSTLTGGTDGENNGITFFDAQEFGATKTISVAFVNGGASQAFSLDLTEDATSISFTFNLATDADGNITTTADDIRTFLDNDTGNAAVRSREVLDFDIEGDGSEAVIAQASAVVDIDSRILQLTSDDYGSSEKVQVNVLAGTFATTGSDGVTASTYATGVDLQATINGQQASTDGLTATIRTSSLDASLAFAEGANVVGERTSLSIVGGGSLFQIGQEVTAAGQVGIGIEAVNTARLGGVNGKLYEIGTGGGKSLLDVGPDVPGSTLVGIVEDAITRVSNLRGRLGAIQKNVIETNVNTLGVALENISEARSSIVDTDYAESTAELTKSQILSQSGISVLSIANQAPQQVLSLLG